MFLSIKSLAFAIVFLATIGCSCVTAMPEPRADPPAQYRDRRVEQRQEEPYFEPSWL
ncbi:hypothetical protein FKP32DRAFT_1587279 [Trametes sanguinea]|nr:hypothetical protein FKP32DRAFT_1587279 [Trametes sanguinea]